MTHDARRDTGIGPLPNARPMGRAARLKGGTILNHSEWSQPFLRFSNLENQSIMDTLISENGSSLAVGDTLTATLTAKADALLAKTEAVKAAKAEAKADRVAKAEQAKRARVDAEAEARRMAAPLQSSGDSDPLKTGATINDMADALGTMLARRKVVAESIGTATNALNTAEAGMVETCRPHFLMFFEYFDIGSVGCPPAYKSIHGFPTMDAATAILFNVAEGDKAALKAARNTRDYRRRVGAKLAGAELRGSGGSTPEPKALDVQISNYLKARLPKLSTAQLASLAELVNEAWRVKDAADKAARLVAA